MSCDSRFISSQLSDYPNEAIDEIVIETPRTIMAREIQGLPEFQSMTSRTVSWNNVSEFVLKEPKHVSFKFKKLSITQSKYHSYSRSLIKKKQRQYFNSYSFILLPQSKNDKQTKLLRRKSFQEGPISDKQARLNILYPVGQINQLQSQTNIRKVTRQKTIFNKMSTLLLKHTAVIRALSYWGNKRSPAMKGIKNKFATNPILLYRKLKTDYQQEPVSQPVEVEKEEKVVLEIEKRRSRKSLAIQQYLHEKNKFDKVSPIKRFYNNIPTQVDTVKQSVRGSQKLNLLQLPNLNPQEQKKKQIYNIYLKNQIK